MRCDSQLDNWSRSLGGNVDALAKPGEQVFVQEGVGFVKTVHEVDHFIGRCCEAGALMVRKTSSEAKAVRLFPSMKA
jgi:hypothetical protein